MLQARLREASALIRVLQESAAAGEGTNALLGALTEHIYKVVDGDKGTVFMVDAKANALWSRKGEATARTDLDKPSIPATVTKTGSSVSVADVYSDDRFSPDEDKKSGYKTTSLLCAPMRASSDGPVIGVVQVVNKQPGGYFDEEDDEMLTLVLEMVGPIVGGVVSEMAARDEKAKARAESEVD